MEHVGGTACIADRRCEHRLDAHARPGLEQLGRCTRPSVAAPGEQPAEPLWPGHGSSGVVAARVCCLAREFVSSDELPVQLPGEVRYDQSTSDLDGVKVERQRHRAILARTRARASSHQVHAALPAFSPFGPRRYARMIRDADHPTSGLGVACATSRFVQCDAGAVRAAGNMRALLAGGLLIAMLAATACSGAGDDRQFLTESTMPRAEAVKWTGLDETTGLAIDLVHEEGFQDTLVEVVLRGSAADIDRAMTSAKFATELSPGLTVQAPPEGFDPNQLADVRSAQQAWTNHLGQHIYRNAIRGRLGNGDDMLFFTAFST